MSIVEFSILYIIDLVILLWIVRWGGAGWLENSFIAGFLNYFAIGWRAEGIKLFALLWLIISTILFFVGLIEPELRELAFL